MAVSTSTTLASLLPEIVAEAIFQANEQSLMRSLVRNYNIPAGSGNTIKVPVYPTFTAVAGTEATAFTGAGDASVNTGSVQLVAGEVGMTTTISDIAMIGSASNVIADVGGQFGRGIAEKIDADLCALFTNLNGGTKIGTGATAITGAAIFQAIATLRANKVPASNMACVLHPEVAYDLKSSITSTFANPNDGLATEVMRNSFVGTLGGVPVYESAAIVSTTGDSIGAVFHRDALGLAMMKDITVETQRESTLRADTLTASAVYGVGELIDTYGIGLNYDSSIVPTP
jgi:N4-gp56 family major capsid protein